MAFDALSFIQRELAKPSKAPTKRQRQNASGRNGRKQWNGKQTSYEVGGTANTINAIYEGRDSHNNGLKPCYVRESEAGLSTNPQFAGPEYTAPQGQWLGRVGCV